MAVVLVATGASGNGLNANLRSTAQPRAVSSCDANADLAVVFDSPGDGFEVLARHPVPLQVLAVGCDGNAVNMTPQRKLSCRCRTLQMLRFR